MTRHAIRYFRVSLALLFCAGSALPIIANAAELYFDSNIQEIGVGDSFTIDLKLNSNEGVNALEGKVVYPADLLELKEISDGNSIVPLWINRPVIGAAIDFAGIIPGGYAARGGKVFSLRFSAKSAGSGAIVIKNSQLLINDGQGTAAPSEISNFQFLVSKTPIGAAPPLIEDRDPPESFKPQVASDPQLFDGKSFLVFATQDKGSGISYYEVAEEQGIFQPRSFKWERAESPYLLQDQSLESWVFVKSVDNNGNERAEVLLPIRPSLVRRVLTSPITLIVILAVLLIIGRLFLTKHAYKISSRLRG